MTKAKRPKMAKAAINPTSLDWPRLISQLTDATFGFPPDVVFQIVENDQVHEIDAHKVILGMVSPYFKTDVGDKTSKVLKLAALRPTEARSSAPANLLSATARLLQETDTADITLVCGSNEWRLHSLILAMRSPFFKAAMSNDMVEKQTKTITVKELEPKVMQQVINYMHGIPIEIESVHCLPDLKEAADRFLMKDMADNVTDIAIRNITIENAVELGKLAEEHGMDKVFEACVEYVIKNKVEVKEDLTLKFANSMVRFLQNTVKDKSGNMNGDKHPKVRCDGCGLKTVVGFRYKCLTCKDFDLCGSCESAGIHPEHHVIRIPSPEPDYKIKITYDSVNNQGIVHFNPMI